MIERSNSEWITALGDDGSARQQEAFRELSHYLHRVAWTYIARRGANLPGLVDLDQTERAHLSQECTQEALIKIYQNLDQYSAQGAFLAWASTIVRRGAGEILRKAHWQSPRYSAVEPTADDMAQTVDRFMQLYQNQGDESLPHDKKVQLDEMMQIIGQVVESGLSARQRTAFLERFAHERTSEEIAIRLESNRDAVHQLIHQARLKIKRALTAVGYGSEDL